MTWHLIKLNCPFCLNATLSMQSSLCWKSEYDIPINYILKKYHTQIICGGCNRTIAKSYQYHVTYWQLPTEEQKKRIEDPLGLWVTNNEERNID